MTNLDSILKNRDIMYFGHLMRRANSLEKTLMLGGIGGRRRRGQQRMRWSTVYNPLSGNLGYACEELVLFVENNVPPVVLHETPHTGAAARENPRDATVIAR